MIQYTKYLIFAISLTTIWAQEEEKSKAQSEEIIRISATSDLGPVTGRASGILHSISGKTPESLLAPIRPYLFRGGYSPQPPSEDDTLDGNYSRLEKLGCRHFQIIMSDAARPYGENIVYPGDNGDWGDWDAKIDHILQSVKASGQKVEYDIWNEPNHPHFWHRSFNQFLEMWKRTFQRIRTAQPNAVIVGPSTAEFFEDWMTAFLRFAKENEVLPDILSWHENAAHSAGQKPRPEAAAAHKATALQIMKNEGIRIDRFSINEFATGHDDDIPGAVAAYLTGLELADVESAARSCWKEPSGKNSAHSGTLDGLLTMDDMQPRADWWVYKAYAGLRGRLVYLHIGESLSGIAASDKESGEATLLLGRFGETNSPVRVVWRDLDKIGIVDGQKVSVSVDRIPSSGLNPLPALEEVMEKEATSKHGELELILPQVNAGEAYIVSLKKQPEA